MPGTLEGLDALAISASLANSTLVVAVGPTPGKRLSVTHPQVVPNELPVVTFQLEVTPLERA